MGFPRCVYLRVKREETTMSPWTLISKLRGRRSGKESALGPAFQADASEKEQFPVENEAPAEALLHGPVSSIDTGHAPFIVQATDREPSAADAPVEEDPSEEFPMSAPLGNQLSARAPGSEKHPADVEARPQYKIRSSKKAATSSRISLGTSKQPRRSPDASIPQNYITDIVGLDDDIKRLRVALAEKLEAQNSQLKSMLLRFDG